MNKIQNCLAITTLLCLTALPARAETTTDRTALEDFVAARQENAEAERLALESRARELGLPLSLEKPGGTFLALDHFTPDGQPVYLTTSNLDAARTISTDDVWSGGSAGLNLNGAGQLLAIWDSGSVRMAHQELAGRITLGQSVAMRDHSTHVAGTMIAAGIDPLARGMAGSASLRSWDFLNDAAEMAAEQLLPTPPTISNHSYVFVTGWIFGTFGCSNGADPQWYFWGDVSVNSQEDRFFGLYGSAAAAWDQIAFAAPDYLIVRGVGNDRGEGPTTQPVAHCQWNGALNGGAGALEASPAIHPIDGGANGFDTIAGGSGTAKNVLTIGAVADLPLGYSGPASVVMTEFSGWGPTDDGRIKPDLVANGTEVYSAIATSNMAYGVISGTSMATPTVSGSIALLRQHAGNLGLDLMASTFKALAIHSAQEAGDHPGPDYSFGWGLFDTQRAARILTQHSQAGVHIFEANLAEGETATYEIWTRGDQPLKATLVWTDPSGPVDNGSQADSPTLRLINDLDLAMSGPEATTFLPWVLDPNNPDAGATTGNNDRDNVEQVVVASPASGRFLVTVAHEGSLSAPQAYSLIIDGNFKAAIFSDGFESGTTGAWSLSLP